MSAITASKKVVGGLYNFAIDKGSVGLIPLGVYAPANCVIDRFWINPQIACTGGAGSTGGFVLGNPKVITLFPDTPIANFTAGRIFPGVDFNASPTGIGTSDLQVYFKVAVNAWTAGAIAFAIEYTYGNFTFNGTQVINPPPSVDPGFVVAITQP